PAFSCMVNSFGVPALAGLFALGRPAEAETPNFESMILQKIRDRAPADIQHIILPEGEDIRTIQAASICVRDRMAKISLIGNDEKVRAFAAEAGENLNGVEIIDHRKSHDFGKMA